MTIESFLIFILCLVLMVFMGYVAIHEAERGKRALSIACILAAVGYGWMAILV